MKIDPLETLLHWLQADDALLQAVGGRMAGKHRYPNTWTLAQPGLVLRLDGGREDGSGLAYVAQIDVSIYAPGQEAAMQLWLLLETACKRAARARVPTSNGDALLYWADISSFPSMLWDEEIGLDVAESTVRAMVGKTNVEIA